MFKTKRLVYLRIEQLLIVMVFSGMIYFKRELLLNSYNRQIELNIRKINRSTNDNLRTQSENYWSQKMKDDFTTQLNTLILIIITGSLVLLNLQRRLNHEKNKDFVDIFWPGYISLLNFIGVALLY